MNINSQIHQSAGLRCSREQLADLPVRLPCKELESKEATPPTFYVRDAGEEDLEHVVKVILEAFETFCNVTGQEFDEDIEDLWPAVRDWQSHPKKSLLVAVSLDDNGKEQDVIGMAGLQMADPIASVPLVAVSTQKSRGGVGRSLMHSLLDICGKRGDDSSVCLMQDTANSASFSLYTSLGFDVVEVCTYFDGFVSDSLADEAIRAVEREGTRFRLMQESDVLHCNEMFMNAVGHSRLESIKKMQSTTDPHPSLVAVRSLDDGREEAVAYCTSFTWLGHSVSIDERHLMGLLSFASKLGKSEGREELVFLCMPRVNPAIIRWVLKAGLRIKRQMVWMVRGGSLSVNPKYVYTPATDC